MGHKALSEDYEVDHGAVLGRGRFSTVKSVFCRRHQRRVAAKIIPLSEESDDSLSAILREYHILSKLDHENIVDVYDCFVNEGCVWIIMELAQNGDLRKFVHARRRLSEKLARKFFAQILAGVAYMHSLDIVHRDIKCENILVMEPGDIVKLGDMGCAVTEPSQASSDRPHTTQERVYGSPAYAAPEVLERVARDSRATDVWSAGVVLFFMVAGYLPFGCDEIGTIRARMGSPLRWPRPLRQLGKSCRDYVQSLLRPRPEDRPTAVVALHGTWLVEK